MVSTGRRTNLIKHLVPSPSLGIVLLAALAPLFWIKSGHVAKAEDFILPMNLDQWVEFFSTWQTRVGFGSSPDDRLPALFFLFWPALFRALGASIELAQRLQFVFWCLAAGLSMYMLMRYLTKSRIAWSVASLIYMFNFYQEPIWQGVNIANLSALVAMPLALAITIRFAAGARLLPSVTLLALTSVIGSGVGANPPMALIAMVPVPLYMIAYFTHRLVTGQRAAAIRMLTFACVSLVVVALINAYWLIPQSYGLLSGGPGQNFIGRTKTGAFAQLVNLSKSTGPTNVWRLQGAWTWYGGHLGIPYVPYSSFYLLNPIAIVASFVFPVLTFTGFLAAKGRKLVFFTGIGMLGLILSMGVNGPFGSIYAWLWDNIPLFWVVRSPWYKATALTILGFAPLAGIGVARTISYLSNALPKISPVQPKLVRRTLIVLFLLYFVGYNAPILRGAFFMDRPADSPLPGLQVRLPDHLNAAAEWLDTQPGDFRVLALPPTLRQTTDWGFTSYIPAIGELTQTPFINLVEPAEMQSSIYSALLKSDSVIMRDILAYAGIRYVLVQNDVVSSNSNLLPEEPIEDVLGRHHLELEVTFGPLAFYRVPDNRPLVWGSNDLLISPLGLESLPSLIGLVGGEGKSVLLDSQVYPDLVWDLITRPEEETGFHVRVLGSGLDLALDLVAQREGIVLPAGTTSESIELTEPGTYEVWQKRSPAEISGLDPQARLLLATSFIRVGDQHVLVEGRPLERGSWKLGAEEVHKWDFLGTFEGKPGLTNLRIWGLSAWVETSTLLVIRQSERDAAAVSLTVGTDKVQGFLAAVPDDISRDPRDQLAIKPLENAWGDPIITDDGEEIRRILAVQKYLKNIQIENDLDTEQSVAIVVRPQSYEVSRSLWIKVGDKFVSTFVISPDVRHEIVVQGINLPPGESWINLYSPDADTVFPNDEYASFDYLFPFEGGPLRRERSFDLEKESRYRLMIGLIPGPDRGSDPAAVLRSLMVDDREYLDALQVEATGRAAFVDLNLASGTHTLLVDQRIGTTLPVLLGEIRPELFSETSMTVDYERHRPTSMSARVNASGPYILILNELYDPRWSAKIDGTPIGVHFKINGFANAFYVPTGGDHTVELSFDIQPLADRSLALSGVTVLAILATNTVNMIRKRRSHV